MIRILGIGSPLGDDQVAWRVIEALRERLPAVVDLHALDRPGATLVNWMRDVHWLILVDALRSDAAPGSVVKIDPQTLAEDAGAISSHAMRLADSLQLAAALDCLPPRLDIYGIEIATLDGSELSAAASDGAARLSQRLIGILQKTG